MMRPFVASLTLLVFLLRLLLAAIPMPQPALAVDANLVAICSADGVKWIHLDPQAPAAPAKTGNDCPLCLAAQGLAMALPVADAPLPIVAGVAAATARSRHAPLLCMAAPPLPGRGPPLLSYRETLIQSL